MIYNLQGRDFLKLSDWTKDEINHLLMLAYQMKQERFSDKWNSIFKNKSFLMFFLNSSLRTRSSFELAALELGGHALFMTPENGRFKINREAGEETIDAAKVMEQFYAGIGIRATEDALPHYGAGQALIEEYAKHANIPVINMQSDIYHPCQALADIMGFIEHFSLAKKFDLDSLKNKKILLTWAKGKMARTQSSINSTLIAASMFEMDITIARPDGYDLDSNIHKEAKSFSSNIKIINDPESGYENADIIYSRNWISENAYQNEILQKQQEIDKAMQYKNWITDSSKMAKTNNAIFTHCMPIDRGNEVTDEVANSNNSIIYNVAGNRLHTQKALMTLTMGDK